MIDTRIGPYRVVRKIGEGGLGAVYEALHEATQRRVAMRVLRPEYARSPELVSGFFNEALAVNRVSHPGLVPIIDSGQLADGGAAYIVMELLRGEVLGNRIKRLAGPMPVPQVLSIAQHVAAALVAAHKQGVVHRDLKPDNVMLVPDPATPGGERAKLLDCGVSKFAAGGEPTEARTGASAVLGTPAYMSPEQCRGAAQLDGKSDVYSLGVMLFVMLSGKRPFTGVVASEVIAKQIHDSPPRLRGLVKTLPPAIAELVHKLLAKDKDDRPTMLAVLEELGSLAGGLGLPVLEPPAGAAGSADATPIRADAPAEQSTGERSEAPEESLIPSEFDPNFVVSPRRMAVATAALIAVLLVSALVVRYMLGASQKAPHIATTAGLAAHAPTGTSAPTTPPDLARIAASKQEDAGTPAPPAGPDAGTDRAEPTRLTVRPHPVKKPRPGGAARPHRHHQ